MRGIMRIPNPFLRVVIATIIAGATAASAGAQMQQPAIATHTAADGAPAADVIPVTTSSPDARHDYELALLYLEDLLFTDKGLVSLRQAVKADSQFALAHAALAYFTTDPVEERREYALAQKNISNASPDERLLIRWMDGAKNGGLVPAIAAMNDLLAKYPNDKRLANMASGWLCFNQAVYEHGEKILKNVLQNDPNYFPALNNLAYCYALNGQPNLAPPLMDRYVIALPAQPNPQDSYGEIMRMLGDYPAALDHYRKALQIDPSFYTSQLGIASTYALMGDQERARVEYLKAVSGTKERATRLDYRILWAMTYYRGNQLERGAREFTKLAAEAHAADLPVEEAEIYRDMALFNPDPQRALKNLDAARVVLAENHEISQGSREIELANILRTRAFIAERAGMADAAQKALKPLSAMAQTSRSNLVQQAYHSANGAVLITQEKYDAAISELQEDPQNPLSLQLLADAQNKAGQTADAQKTLSSLAAINDERVETAFAAPPARAALKNSSPATAQAGTH
jgi:tetratricopeptide (TPR) repeat protein